MKPSVGLATLFVCLLLAGCGAPNTPSPAGSKLVSKEDSSAAVELKRVGIRVNTMSCVEGCFKGIQAVLEKRPGIDKVELAPQKDSELIDNSVIFVTYKGALDNSEVERTILGAGFDSIEFIDAQ